MNVRRALRALTLPAALVLLGTSGWSQERTATARSLGEAALRASRATPVRSATPTRHYTQPHRRGADVRVSSHRGSRSYRSYHSPRRVWIPGHYERVARKVFVPGCLEKVWVDPVYETRYDGCGNPYRVLICAGYWKEIQRPGRYETRYENVWVPGHFERC